MHHSSTFFVQKNVQQKGKENSGRIENSKLALISPQTYVIKMLL